jgi:hypothetical protein
MFSALVLIQQGAKGPPSSEAVVRTLSALVPAAIEGIVRDLVLASQSRNDDFARIADHAGCEYVHASGAPLVASGLAALKERRVLVVRAGRIPEHGFTGELADLAAYRAQQCALLLDAPNSFLTRVMPRLARPSGVVAPQDALKDAPPDLSSMAKALPSPIVFKARMIGED